MKEMPFTDENLRSVLPAPSKPASECANCRAIGGAVSKLDKGGDEGAPLPAAVGTLVYFMGLGENVATNWLERCPECGGLYYAERSYEFLTNGSETYESHEPITPEGVLQLPEVSWARTPQAVLRGHDDGHWQIVVHPEKKLPQRRA